MLSKNIEPKLEIKLDETVLEMVDDFQYLGAWVNNTMEDFKHRRAKAWTSFWHSNADIKLKIMFFNASVLSVLLYARETYVINAALENKINAFQTQCLRIILNICREDYVRNKYIYTNKQTQSH